MIHGLLAGILWGLDTVILGIALAMTPFVSTEEAIVLAPFVSTFIHDACSACWMFLYMGTKKQLKLGVRALKTKSGKFIVLAALLGGPIGMTGYVSAINYIGPGYTAIISAMFPAIGAVLSYVFLKEKMSKVQIAGLAVSILSVIGLSYTPDGNAPENFFLGLLCALLCAFGWAAEAVICAYGLKDPDITDEQALQIRQTTSALTYAAIILPVISGWNFTVSIIPTTTSAVILLSALFGTASYVMYYRAISKIGATRAMALNITYSAWSIVFAILLLGTLPSVTGIVFGILLICGSLVAANGLPQKKTKD